MARKGTGVYPAAWPDIAKAVKDAAGWCCVRCGHPHDPPTGYTLTVHHLNGRKDDSFWANTVALCQRCHLRIQGRVDMDRPWVMAEHTAWARVYMAAHYARRYLGETLTRAETEARLDELLQLERRVVLGVAS